MDGALVSEIDYTFFNKLFETNDFTKMNMYEVCKFIHDATYIRFGQKYYETKAELDHVTLSVIKLTGQVEDLKRENESLRFLLEEE